MSEKNKPFQVSDESINSFGFRMKTSGMQRARFDANPVMLDGHVRENSKVLGRWENLRVEGTTILADAVWDIEDPYALNIKRKVDKGFIKGCSLSAEPLKATYNEVDDLLEIIEWELKEISIACVPSNAGSLVLCDKQGNILNKAQLIALSDNSQTIDLTKLTKTDMKITNKTLLKVLNLKDESEETEVAIAVQAIINDRDTSKENEVKLTAANKTLTDEVMALKATTQTHLKERSVSLVDGAVAGGKLLAAERDAWVELADSNFEGTKKVLDAKKAHVSISKRMDDNTADLADKTKDWTFDEFHKAAKIADLKLSDPDRYKQLFKDKFGKEPNE